MVKKEYGKPIKIFYANLLWSGVRLSVDNGRLYVDGNLDVLSPAYRDEIVKRKTHLVQLLTPAPPPELESYFGRLLKLDELQAAFGVAKNASIVVDTLPVNGGWLLSTKKELA